jgi:hypothetical protein
VEELCILKNGFVALFADLQNEIFLVHLNCAKTDSSSRGCQQLFIRLFKN